MTFTPIGLQASDIAQLIATDSAQRPRSRQAAPGPSSLGHPCPRHLAHLHAGTPKTTGGGDPLPSWVGTEAHAGMARILDGLPDWEAEIPVELPGYGIRGTCDAYHRPSRLVLDWKFVGAAAIGDYKANGPGPQYRTQVHLYGLALALTGRDVDRVGIAFIPRAGLSSGIHLWAEDLDEQVCDDALRRWDAIVQVADTLGPAAAPTSGDARCDWCPYYDPGGTDPATSCAGHQPPTVTGTVTEPTQSKGTA